MNAAKKLRNKAKLLSYKLRLERLVTRETRENREREETGEDIFNIWAEMIYIFIIIFIGGYKVKGWREFWAWADLVFIKNLALFSSLFPVAIFELIYLGGV